MDENAATVIFQIPERAFETDLEIPLSISADELLHALTQAYGLQSEEGNDGRCHLKAERPIAMLKGGRTLADFGIGNGSVIRYDPQTNGQ